MFPYILLILNILPLQLDNSKMLFIYAFTFFEYICSI